MNSNYRVIGLMSGTSLDGLDIVGVDFHFDGLQWTYEISCAETISYPSGLRERLKNAIHVSEDELSKLDLELGDLFGISVKQFISRNNFKPHFISSHGHTIFHQPQEKLTLQIGSAKSINSKTGIPVVFDFRSLDIKLGGQGAPLVPVGDHYLFSEFDACLNLGGIANISCVQQDRRIAFDICACNIVFNHFANLKGMEYDEGGEIAEKGNIIPELLDYLNGLQYYSISYPKSLGFEEIEKQIIVPVAERKLPTSDVLRTCAEHFSDEIAKNITSFEGIGSLLITGGGAHNTFFVELLKSKLVNIDITIPDKMLVDFKEAVVFAFLGTLRTRGEDNVFCSVTGSQSDSSSGSIIGIGDQNQ